MTWLLALECFAPMHLLDLKSPSLFHYMFAYAIDACPPFGEDPCLIDHPS
jgi:hypothetical protein